MAHQSLLAKILAMARDRSAAMMRRFLDTGDTACDFDSDGDDEDDDDNILHFDLCRPAAVMFNNSNHVAPQQIAAHETPVVPPKKTRSKYPRKDQKDSLWWRDFLANAPRADLALHPHGKLAGIFRRDFHVPFKLFQELVELARDRWWSTWNDHNVCRAGKRSNMHVKKIYPVRHCRSPRYEKRQAATLSEQMTMCLNFCTAMDGLTPKTGSVVVQRARREHLEAFTLFATEGIIVGPVASHRIKIMCRAVPLCVGRKI